jgi:GNAT superfamily N-acetyltransferase
LANDPCGNQEKERLSTGPTDEEWAKIKVRIGQEVADIPHVLPLVRQMHKESLFSDFPFDMPQFERICSFIRDDPANNGALYIEYDGTPVAFAYYMYRPFMGSRESWVTVMHTLYIRPDIRSTPLGATIWERIILTVRAWSAPRSSRGLMFNVTSGIAIEETDTILRTAGATPLGGNYLLRI